MWMGSDLSTADEWIELLITGTGAVDLSHWSLTSLDSKGKEATIAQLGLGTTLASGQYFMIANFTADHSRLSAEPQLVSTSMSLPNTKLLLRLRNASGMLIDEVDDGVGNPFAGANGSQLWGKASMERINPLSAGNVQTNWRTATTIAGFDDGVRLYGTPGALNGSGPAADIYAPLEATQVAGSLLAVGTGASLHILWQPSTSLDLIAQLLTITPLSGSGFTLSFGRTATGTTITSLALASDYIFVLRSRDDLGHTSTGITLHIPAPLTGSGSSSSGTAHLRISEVLPDPAGIDTDEWIELQNTGDGPASMNSYQLQVGTHLYQLTGAALQSGAFAVVSKQQSGLSLKNTGDTVILKQSGTAIDTVVYPPLPEGVAFGIVGSGPEQALCVPTPGFPNGSVAWDAALVLQSGAQQGAGKVTLNLIVAATGSLAGASCRVDFGDSAGSASCNPPSHSFSREGDYTVSLNVLNYCGTTVIHQLNVHVSPKGEGGRKITVKSLMNCNPHSGTGVVISEFFPNPSGNEGSEEWIELRNMFDEPADLCGWFVDDQDGGSTPYALDGKVIAPKSYLLLPRQQTHIALDNGSDRVRLLVHASGSLTGGQEGDSHRTVVQEVLYSHAEEQKSDALRDDGVFVWTPYLTPGFSNRFPDSIVPYGSESLLLSALPKPIDGKQAHQWIGITNTTEQAIVIAGWSLVSSRNGSKPFVFDYYYILPGQRLQLRGDQTNLDLKASDILRLSDRDGHLISVFAWNKAQAGMEYSSRTPLMTGTFIGNIDTTRFAFLSVPDESSTGTVIVHLPCVSAVVDYQKNYEQQKYELSLNSNEKYELKKYSLISDASPETIADILTKDQDSLTVELLRSGNIMVDTGCPSPYREMFEVYEAAARSARLGLWASAERVQKIDQLRLQQALERRIDAEGLQVKIRPESGLVQKGSGVTLSSNIPADIYVSVNGESYHRSTGSIIIRKATDIRAYAVLSIPTATGSRRFSSAFAIGSYIPRQEHYANSIVFSELYPSPLKVGHNQLLDREWIELRNKSLQSVNLGGWSIGDNAGSGHIAQLPPTLTVAGNGFALLSAHELKITLNNSGDNLILYDPNKKIKDHIMYSKVLAGMAVEASVSSSDSSVCISNAPTPGARNRCLHFEPKALLDSDRDLVSDAEEKLLFHTDPYRADTDGDSYIDSFEIYNQMSPTVKQNTIYKFDEEYKKFILDKMAVKWDILKTKGLRIRTKVAPIQSAELHWEPGNYTQKAIPDSDGSFTVYRNEYLKAGIYQISLIVVDIVNKKIILQNALSIDLKDNFYPKITSRKKVAKSKTAVKPKVYIVAKNPTTGVASSFAQFGRTMVLRPSYSLFLADILMIGALMMSILAGAGVAWFFGRTQVKGKNKAIDPS